MSYEKEIAGLWKEWKKSTKKYEEAIEDGYDVDADMWANDVETIHRQIHLYEQASKADEYEAKAKAFDEIFKLYIGYVDGWVNYPRGRMSFSKEIINVCKSYESGGSDD